MYTWPFEEGIMNSTFEKIKQAKLWVIHQKWCVTIRRLYCHNTQILVVYSMASNMQSRLARITRIILHVMCSHSSSTMLNHTFQVNPLPLWHDRGFCETTSQFCLGRCYYNWMDWRSLLQRAILHWLSKFLYNSNQAKIFFWRVNCW